MKSSKYETVLVIKSDKCLFCGLQFIFGIKNKRKISILSAVWYTVLFMKNKKKPKQNRKANKSKILEYWSHFEKSL